MSSNYEITPDSGEITPTNNTYTLAQLVLGVNA